jgi:hypothetical protein
MWTDSGKLRSIGILNFGSFDCRFMRPFSRMRPPHFFLRMSISYFSLRRRKRNITKQLQKNHQNVKLQEPTPSTNRRKTTTTKKVETTVSYSTIRPGDKPRVINLALNPQSIKTKSDPRPPRPASAIQAHHLQQAAGRHRPRARLRLRRSPCAT